MPPTISLARIVLATRRRGQALVETMLIAPVLLLLLGGVADLGRAFYYKTAVTNTAREAAHWATLGPARDDTTVLDEVASPSQESFGICLVSGTTACPGGNGGLAPASVVHTAPGTLSPQQLANPPAPDAALTPGSSWLFIYPDFPGRTSLAPGMHWTEVASSSTVVTAESPIRGGLQAVARAAAGSLYAVEADATQTCYSWGPPTLSSSNFTATLNAGKYSVGPLTATLSLSSGSTGSARNTAKFTVFGPVGNPGFQQTWSSTGTSTGSIDPSVSTSDTVNLTATTATPGTYTYQVQVTSSSNCQQAMQPANFTVTFPPVPSPSPSPTPSPTATPSAGPTPTPVPTPTGVEPITPPHARQITCTVIYYFTPVTPLGLLAGNAVYIVGTATLQATY
ncbi:MAG TPA: TadE family protein [Candidatus Solibacter sp.]|nr:TadE family protein [Candidatus Solibacter sp.]